MSLEMENKRHFPISITPSITCVRIIILAKEESRNRLGESLDFCYFESPKK